MKKKQPRTKQENGEPKPQIPGETKPQIPDSIKIHWKMVQPAPATRDEWIAAMLKRHPMWLNRTADDLATWVEEHTKARGIQVVDWAHIFVFINISTERDPRLEPEVIPEERHEWFYAH